MLWVNFCVKIRRRETLVTGHSSEANMQTLLPKPALLFFAALLAELAAPVQAADPPPPKFSDTIEQRVAACTACHGKQGEGVRKNEYYPRIGGKPAGYLYHQLLNFRDGRRTNPQMSYLVRYLPDAYLKEIAEYFAKLQPPFPATTKPSVAPDVLARGEALVTRGDQARDIPACTACHGKALTGTQPAIPSLVGLYPDYISAQLSAWQHGTRQANAPDCMGQIASLLTGADITAVAAWLSRQPGSQTAQSAPAQSQKLPLNCGSQAQ